MAERSNLSIHRKGSEKKSKDTDTMKSTVYPDIWDSAEAVFIQNNQRYRTNNLITYLKDLEKWD